MAERITFEGGTIFGDVSDAGGVWASVRELELCGGTASKVVEAVVYDVVGGAGRRVMSSMGCRVLVPAEDLDQAQGRYYGRIISKDRRVLRFLFRSTGRICKRCVGRR